MTNESLVRRIVLPLMVTPFILFALASAPVAAPPKAPPSNNIVADWFDAGKPAPHTKPKPKRKPQAKQVCVQPQPVIALPAPNMKEYALPPAPPATLWQRFHMVTGATFSGLLLVGMGFLALLAAMWGVRKAKGQLV